MTPIELVILAAGWVGAMVGGALGARLARGPAWKGAVITLLASIAQFIAMLAFDIENPIVNALVFLVAVGLIGGRWGMRLTGKQLSLVVIGGFLLSLLAGVGAMYALLLVDGAVATG